MKKSIIFLISFLVFSNAKANDFAKPASAHTLTGIYELIDYPESNQPKSLKSNPWPSKCQFFGIYKNGFFLHQTTHIGACKNQIPAVIPSAMQDIKWEFVHTGLVSLTNKNSKTVTQVWKVDTVTGNAHIGNINVNKGDLIMQLVGPNNKAIWVRLLKKIGDPL